MKYPFSAVDAETSVEIFHGNHGQVETRSPVYTLVLYKVGGTPHLIAGYLCTPLVTFPAFGPPPPAARCAARRFRGAWQPGSVPSTCSSSTHQAGKDYLLMSNTSRGVMNILTATFAAAALITAPVKEEKAGVGYETITSLQGVEQMDLFDASRALGVLPRAGPPAVRSDFDLVPPP